MLCLLFLNISAKYRKVIQEFEKVLRVCIKNEISSSSFTPTKQLTNFPSAKRIRLACKDGKGQKTKFFLQSYVDFSSQA